MYPDNIKIGDVDYSIQVDYDSDGDVEYFQLISPSGDIVFEYDWAGGFDEDDILSLIRSYSPELLLNEPVVDDEPKKNEVVMDPVIQVEKIDFKDFDHNYPHYSDCSVEFKTEAVKKIKAFSNESRAFQNILVSETADEYEDEGKLY